MKDQKKTKTQLIRELEDMRVRVSEVEASKSEHERAEERIIHLNAVLRAIRNVNQLITKEKDVGRLLRGICDNLVKNRGYHNVWVALLDEFEGLVATAEAGLGSAFHPIAERLKRGMFMACGQNALARPGVVVTEYPFSECVDCPLAAEYGGRGAMTIRLDFEGSVYGLLAVSVPRHLAMDKEEQGLFREVAEDIAFALRNIELEEERKRAENALKESEARHRALFEASVDGILVADVETKKFKHANPAICTMLGYTEEELTRLGVQDIHPKEALEYVLSEFEATVRGERAFVRDIPCLKSDGTIFYVDLSAGRSIVDGRECSIGFFTDRKQAEKALRESEELFRTLFETAPIGLALTRPFDGAVVAFNQKTAELFGGSSEDFTGKKSADFYVRSKDRSHVVTAIKEHGAVKDMEVAFKTLDGRPFLGLFSGTMTKYSGEPVMLSVIMDITDRKKAEEALKESEELFRTLFEIAPIGLVLTRVSDGRVVACNQRIAELFGGSPEEIIGRNSIDFYVNPDERLRLVATIKKYGFIKDVEVAFKTLDGGQFWGLLSSTVTKYGGEPVMLSVIVDITERKEAEDALQKARNDLESRVEERTSDLIEVNKQLMREIKERIRAEGALKSSIAEKEILIREIHHRVKNNLQVISSLLDMGKMRIRDASQAHEMFKEAGAIIQAMALIHSMLYATRQFESVNIAEFVRKLYAQLAQMYVGQSKKITPEFHLEDVHLSIDKAVPLGLVLNEILANVFKHAFPGDDSGKVEVGMRKDDADTVFLRISDNGTGIPEEIDVEAANSMGLKLIRIIVREQLRGTLQVERGRGTMVSMEFIALRTGDSNGRANA